DCLPGLVFYNVGFEYAPKLAPLVPIKNSALFEAFGGSISHVKCVVRVVVNEQTLPAESQQSLDFLEPLIDNIKVRLISDRLGRIRLRESPCEGAQNRN